MVFSTKRSKSILFAPALLLLYRSTASLAFVVPLSSSSSSSVVFRSNAKNDESSRRRGTASSSSMAPKIIPSSSSRLPMSSVSSSSGSSASTLVSSIKSRLSMSSSSTLPPPPTDSPINNIKIIPENNIVVNKQQQKKEQEEEQKSEEYQYGPLSMSFEELSKEMDGAGRAKIVWDCYNIGVDPDHFFGNVIDLGYDDYESILNRLPSRRRNQKLGPGALRNLRKLHQRSTSSSVGGDGGGITNVEGGLASLSYVSRSKDRTTKLLLKLRDGLEVETVIIPWEGKRSTLCISSQVGCRQGCTFCATGKMGKLRNLSSDEILVQMFFAQKLCRIELLPPVSNVVFMGMGEPSDNIENVVRAAKILTTQQFGFGLASNRITVSTVGPNPQCFMDLAKSNSCVLAWSVHAVNDELRKKLVPTTKYKMIELRQGLIDALLSKPINDRICMLEFALMSNVNDQLEQADELIDFVKGLIEQVPGIKPHVNLIPFNDIGSQSLQYEKPLVEDVIKFKQHLRSNGVYAHVRTTRGDDQTSACGQLATKKNNKKIVPIPTTEEKLSKKEEDPIVSL